MNKIKTYLSLCRLRCNKWYRAHPVGFNTLFVVLHVAYYGHAMLTSAGLIAYISGAIAGVLVYQWFKGEPSHA